MLFKCFGLRKPRAGGPGRKPTALKRRDLEESAREASAEVRPWDEDRIILVRDIQKAVRNYGKVQLMRDTLRRGRFMAVKRMPRCWMCDGPEEFELHHPSASEKPWVDIGIVRMLGALDYPYACRLQGVFQRGDEMLVATSFCPEGDLFEWCFRPTVPAPGVEREAHMRPIVAQLLVAVRWLHGLGIAHRDLSLENVLLEDSGAELRVKLIDFGMATMKRKVRNELRGKAAYQAPELHTGGAVDTFLLDNFALGVIMFAMAVQDYPWACTQRGRCRVFDFMASSGLRRLLSKRPLRNGSGELLSEVMSPIFVEVLEALLRAQPRQRGCLDEEAFSGEVRQRRRLSVFDMLYLRGADAALPPRRGGRVWQPIPDTGASKQPSSCGSTCSHCSGASSPSEMSSLDSFLRSF